MLFGLFNPSVDDIVSNFKAMQDQLRALAEAKELEADNLHEVIQRLNEEKNTSVGESVRARKIAANIEKLIQS